ncbi:MAG: histidine phosphatase family protein [Lachnospiraceae bacterium]|nr:histidine phosphatase family protein [Lachnospiraceae bacterium]
MRIVFVRHGEPDYERDCLTELGKVEAELAAKRLASENITEIWSSPLGRAKETAEITARALGLPVKTLDFMREVHWGSTDGKPLFADGHPWYIADDMSRRGIDLNRPDWRETPDFRTNSVLECIDEIANGIDKWLENLGYKRKGPYFEHLVQEEEHKTIALFSHGGSSCAAISHILNLPFPYACALLHFDHTGISVLRFDRRKGNTTLPCLELANDSRHLLGNI